MDLDEALERTVAMTDQTMQEQARLEQESQEKPKTRQRRKRRERRERRGAEELTGQQTPFTQAVDHAVTPTQQQVCDKTADTDLSQDSCYSDWTPDHDRNVDVERPSSPSLEKILEPVVEWLRVHIPGYQVPLLAEPAMQNSTSELPSPAYLQNLAAQALHAVESNTVFDASVDQAPPDLTTARPPQSRIGQLPFRPARATRSSDRIRDRERAVADLQVTSIPLRGQGEARVLKDQ